MQVTVSSSGLLLCCSIISSSPVTCVLSVIHTGNDYTVAPHCCTTNFSVLSGAAHWQTLPLTKRFHPAWTLPPPSNWDFWHVIWMKTLELLTFSASRQKYTCRCSISHRWNLNDWRSLPDSIYSVFCFVCLLHLLCEVLGDISTFWKVLYKESYLLTYLPHSHHHTHARVYEHAREYKSRSSPCTWWCLHLCYHRAAVNDITLTGIWHLQ